jgi:flagellar motor switch protein FliM
MTTPGDKLSGLLGGRQLGIERLPMLRSALEQLGPACVKDLRSLSSAPMRLSLQSIEATTVGAALWAGPGSAAVTVLDAADWSTPLMVSSDRSAVLAMVDMLLGGDGSQSARVSTRPLSKIEIDIAAVFHASLARALSSSFESIAASPFAIQGTADRPDFEVMGREEAVVVARYGLDAPGSGAILILIPRSALEALRKPLSQKLSKEHAPADPRWSEQIQSELTRTSVTLTAILEERVGELADVYNMKVGEIIELNATPQSRIRVECNGERLIWCDLGKSKGVYTIRVDSFIDPDQELLDDILAA